MAGETTLTIIGNLTADPELRFTPSGAAVANFTVASTPRTLDKASGEWKDGDALFMRCNAWRQLGENIAESFKRGDRVIVIGRLAQRSYEHEGQKRTVVELTADEMGPSVKFHPAKTQRPQRAAQAPDDDPWGEPARRPTSPPAGVTTAFDDEPPF